MILYSYFRSSAAFRVRIALHLKGLEFEYRAIHLVKDGGQQYSQAYRKLNPLLEVPCLVQDGQAIGQSMAILLYLDKKYPNPALFPSDALELARVIQISEAINSGIHPVQNLKVLQALQNDYGQTEARAQDWAASWIRRGFEGLEKLLESTAGSFCLGGQLTAADCFLIPQAFNCIRYKVNLADYPTIQRISRHCMGLEAFQKAHPFRQPDTPAEFRQAEIQF